MTHFSESGPKVRQHGKNGEAFIAHSFRVPPAIYQRIKDEAKKSGRSLQAEMLHRVVMTLGEDFVVPAAPVVTSGFTDEMMGVADRLGVAYQRVTVAMVEQQEQVVTEAEGIASRLAMLRRRLDALKRQGGEHA